MPVSMVQPTVVQVVQREQPGVVLAGARPAMRRLLKIWLRPIADHFISIAGRQSGQTMIAKREPSLERKMHVSGAVSGAAVALQATRKAQAIDHIGGPGRTRTCNQTVMSGRNND
ncbi:MULTISPECIES: hypothetical protein [unclassified Bradyrhizobium]